MTSQPKSLEDYCNDDVLKTYYLKSQYRFDTQVHGSFHATDDDYYNYGPSVLTPEEISTILSRFDNQFDYWFDDHVEGPVDLEEWAEAHFENADADSEQEEEGIYAYKRWDIDAYLRDVGLDSEFIDATTGQHINRHEARLAGGNTYIVSR